MAADVPAAFFSYCREDSDFALRLAEDLKAAGANVWIDQLDIEPGMPWDREVEDALAWISGALPKSPAHCGIRFPPVPRSPDPASPVLRFS